MSDFTQPVLYILMRTDLASMNAGKMAAQACHAANRFAGVLECAQEETNLSKLFIQWKHSTNQMFGTTIVLDGGTITDIRDIVFTIDSMNNVDDTLAEIIHDPTYPLIDGSTLHILPLDTCAYVFCDKNNEKVTFLLDKLPLHI